MKPTGGGFYSFDQIIASNCSIHHVDRDCYRDSKKVPSNSGVSNKLYIYYIGHHNTCIRNASKSIVYMYNIIYNVQFIYDRLQPDAQN